MDHAPRKERKETAEKRREHQRAEDDDEMEREYRLLKKLKKGTLSEVEFAEATSTADESERVLIILVYLLLKKIGLLRASHMD
jgi:hypothetical protein